MKPTGLVSEGGLASAVAASANFSTAVSAAVLAALVAGALGLSITVVSERVRSNLRLRKLLGKYDRGAHSSRPRLRAPIRTSEAQQGTVLRNSPPKTIRLLGVLDEQLAAAGLLVSATTWLIGSAILALLVGVMSGFATGSGAIGLAVAVTAATAAIFGYLPSQIRRRQDRFARQLPIALQSIAGSLRSGATILSAFDGVAQLQNDEVSFQFQRALAEVQFGADLVESLSRVASRMKNQDLRWLVLALEIHAEVGGPVNQLIDGVAVSITERAEVEMERRVVSAEGRLSARILMAVPFVAVLAIYCVRPGYLNFLVATQTGLGFSLVFALLMFGGWFWMRRILRVE